MEAVTGLKIIFKKTMFHRIFLLYGDVTTDGKWLRVILIVLHMQ